MQANLRHVGRPRLVVAGPVAPRCEVVLVVDVVVDCVVKVVVDDELDDLVDLCRAAVEQEVKKTRRSRR